MCTFRSVCRFYHSDNSELGRISYILLKDTGINWDWGKAGMLKYLISHEKASAETLRGFMELYDIYDKKRKQIKSMETIYG
jgi:hypothetical protein